MTAQRRYSREDYDYIVDNWGKVPPAEMAQTLNRSLHSLYNHSRLRFGLPMFCSIKGKRLRRPFTAEEDAYIRQNWKPGESTRVAEALGRHGSYGADAVRDRAVDYLGLAGGRGKRRLARRHEPSYWNQDVTA